MGRERIIWIVALIVVAAAGFYTGNFIGTRNGEQSAAQASQQFYSQRGGGNGQTGNGNGQGGGFAGRGVSGTVASIDGNTLMITTRAGQTQKVQLASGATVGKQVSGQLSDISTGEQITAIGQANGDTFQATSIQIGGGFGGGRGGTNGAGPGGATPNTSATPAPKAP